MAKHRAVDPTTLDWSKFESSMPREGVVYPKGDRRRGLISRILYAFRKIGIRQPA